MYSCSVRYASFSGRHSTRFIDSLARRRAIGLFDASVRASASRLVEERGTGHDRAHAPRRCSSAALIGLAGEEQLAGLVPADEPRQVGAGTEEADVDLGRAEGGVVRGDDHVAARGEREPAPRAGPLTAAITGTAQSVMAHMPSRAHRPGRRRSGRRTSGHGRGADRAQVDACHEGAVAGGGEDGDPDVAVAAEAMNASASSTRWR